MTLIIWALIGSTQIEEDGKMALNVTPFVGTDNFNMETFNNMISQINSGVNSEISDVLAQLDTKAKIQTGSYVGTGTYGASNPCSLTFDFEPKIVFIQGPLYVSGVGLQEQTLCTIPIYRITYTDYLTYAYFINYTTSTLRHGYYNKNNKTVYWYASDSQYATVPQMNKGNINYQWFAIG